jgi:hypothetical protein
MGLFRAGGPSLTPAALPSLRSAVAPPGSRMCQGEKTGHAPVGGHTGTPEAEEPVGGTRRNRASLRHREIVHDAGDDIRKVAKVSIWKEPCLGRMSPPANQRRVLQLPWRRAIPNSHRRAGELDE